MKGDSDAGFLVSRPWLFCIFCFTFVWFFLMHAVMSNQLKGSHLLVIRCLSADDKKSRHTLFVSRNSWYVGSRENVFWSRIMNLSSLSSALAEGSMTIHLKICYGRPEYAFGRRFMIANHTKQCKQSWQVFFLKLVLAFFLCGINPFWVEFFLPMKALEDFRNVACLCLLVVNE